LSCTEDAENWLRANVDNWLGALRSAADRGQHSAVVDCAESMHWFSDRWAHAAHWRLVFTLGAGAAAALDDLPRQAAQLNYLARVYGIPPSDPHAMLRYAADALDLAAKSGTQAQIAGSHQYTARAQLLLGRLDEAVASAFSAAKAFDAIGDIDAYAQCLSLIGLCRRHEGRYAEALEQFRTALALIDDEASGMTPTIAARSRPDAHFRIAQCLVALGRRTDAISTLTEAIVLMETLRPDLRQAEALQTLAALLAEEGRTEQSRTTYARAAQVYEAIGDAEASSRCHAAAP
jgi:tetratricopeptide (TPR) repeat protein